VQDNKNEIINENEGDLNFRKDREGERSEKPRETVTIVSYKAARRPRRRLPRAIKKVCSEKREWEFNGQNDRKRTQKTKIICGSCNGGGAIRSKIQKRSCFACWNSAKKALSAKRQLGSRKGSSEDPPQAVKKEADCHSPAT